MGWTSSNRTVAAFSLCEIVVHYLLGTGFHPEQICHSVTALFINIMSTVDPKVWDDDVKKLVQGIIVQISLHTQSFSGHWAGLRL